MAQDRGTACAAARGAAPCVDKIDPPNWWAGLPSPMLLLHGRHLSAAHISITGKSATIERTRISTSGDWAFVWLQIAHASPQKLELKAATQAGQTSAKFELFKRKPADDGFKGFSSADVMYLIMTDRFADGDPSNDAPADAPDSYDRTKPRGWHGGDFRGIEQHLSYLRQLGVTTVWTTPVYNNNPSPEAYHGYIATDMYAVDAHFGTLADYQHLAEALHKRGMKLVLDTVPNHVGPANPWVKDPPTPDWFHGTLAHHDIAKGDFESIPDPHSSWQERKDITQGWFANVLPDLNQENPLVAQYLIQNAVWWVETAGLDGLRIDTFPYVSRAFWQQFHAELHTIFPHLTTVGEVFNSDPTITSYFAGGATHDGIDTGLYTPFDFPMYFTLRSVLVHGAPMTKLEDVLREDWLYPHPERLVTFLGNHDTKRFLSEPGATAAELKIAFGLLATLRGMPQIYSGDEIAMLGGSDPDNRRDFPGGFPVAASSGDKANAFTVAGRTPQQAEMFDWTSRLFRFRDQQPVLQAGKQQDIFMDGTAFVFVRAMDINSGCKQSSPDRLLVAVNDSDKARDLTLRMNGTALAGCSKVRESIGANNRAPVMRQNSLTLVLGAKQIAIYSVQ